MLGKGSAHGARLGRLLAAALVCLCMSAALDIGQSRAALWMQVSCVNPDGSAAPADGWTPDTVGIAEAGSQASTACAPGSPMVASLSADAPATGGVKEALQYTPPAGSTLVGGQLDVHLQSASSGPSAAGAAALYEPALVDDENDAFLVCSAILQPCQNGTDTFDGQVALPSGRGGDLYLGAECAGSSSSGCSTGSQDGTWALAELGWARLLLSTAAVPQASHFGGSALQPGASGIAHLVFTATDGAGPGILSATVTLDGATVYAGTPDTNGGACASVGTDPASGAPMYDHAQPCPATEVVDLPVPTAGLPDGAHRLAVSITDAAGTTSPVLDQRITTFNPQRTPVPRGRHAVRAQFVISWRWAGGWTRLRSIRVARLPRRARLTISCAGLDCPRLHVSARGTRRIRRALRGLSDRRLRAGDRVRITVRAPHRRAERIELRIRPHASPRARLLRR